MPMNEQQDNGGHSPRLLAAAVILVELSSNQSPRSGDRTPSHETTTSVTTGRPRRRAISAPAGHTALPTPSGGDHKHASVNRSLVSYPLSSGEDSGNEDNPDKVANTEVDTPLPATDDTTTTSASHLLAPPREVKGKQRASSSSQLPSTCPSPSTPDLARRVQRYTSTFTSQAARFSTLDMPTVNESLFVEGPHLEYKLVAVHTARCNVCGRNNTTQMFECVECTVCICEGCAGKYASTKAPSSASPGLKGMITPGFEVLGPYHETFKPVFREWKERKNRAQGGVGWDAEIEDKDLGVTITWKETRRAAAAANKTAAASSRGGGSVLDTTQDLSSSISQQAPVDSDGETRDAASGLSDEGGDDKKPEPTAGGAVSGGGGGGNKLSKTDMFKKLGERSHDMSRLSTSPSSPLPLELGTSGATRGALGGGRRARPMRVMEMSDIADEDDEDDNDTGNEADVEFTDDNDYDNDDHDDYETEIEEA